MPIILLYQCAQCGAEAPRSEMGAAPPPTWISVNADLATEWFDTWECVQGYTQEKMAATE